MKAHEALGRQWATILGFSTRKLRTQALREHIARLDRLRIVTLLDDACRFAQRGDENQRVAYDTVLDAVFEPGFAGSQLAPLLRAAYRSKQFGACAVMGLAQYNEQLVCHARSVGLTRLNRAVRRATTSSSSAEIDPQLDGLWSPKTAPEQLFAVARRAANLVAGVSLRGGLDTSDISEGARRLHARLRDDPAPLVMLGIASGPWRRHRGVRTALLATRLVPSPILNALACGTTPAFGETVRH